MAYRGAPVIAITGHNGVVVVGARSARHGAAPRPCCPDNRAMNHARCDVDDRASIGHDGSAVIPNMVREAQLNPGVRVVVAADEALIYKDVVKILDIIKQAGVTRVALSSEK